MVSKLRQRNIDKVSNLIFISYHFLSFRITSVVMITQIILQNEIKIVSQVIKYKTNSLYSLGHYIVIN